MAKLDWSKDKEEPYSGSARGCNFLFFLVLLLFIPIGLMGVSTAAALVNPPERQIMTQLPKFVAVPSYDAKDYGPKIEKIQTFPEEEAWYEVKIHADNQQDYAYLVKVKVKNKLFLNPELKVIEVETR